MGWAALAHCFAWLHSLRHAFILETAEIVVNAYDNFLQSQQPQTEIFAFINVIALPERVTLPPLISQVKRPPRLEI